MIGLKDKVVLITGSTSGIGQSIAVRFAQEGSKVAINYRKVESDAAETDAAAPPCLNLRTSSSVTRPLRPLPTTTKMGSSARTPPSMCRSMLSESNQFSSK